MIAKQAKHRAPKARRADERDAACGRKVRARRLEQGMSQTALANRCGVTFQQIQKYEKGVNRIGAGRLERIAEALDVPPSFFLNAPTKFQNDGESILAELAQDRGAVRLLTLYGKLNRQKRLAMIANAEALAA